MGKLKAPAKTLKNVKTSSLKLKGLQIQAEFMALGFKTLPEFAAVVKFYYPELQNIPGSIDLFYFWKNKKHTTELHNKLETVLETLKFI